MDIKQIIEKIDCKLQVGLQLTKKKGIITSTWIIYKRNEFYYLFDICEELIFDFSHCYSHAELLLEFENCYFEIDMEVC